MKVAEDIFHTTKVGIIVFGTAINSKSFGSILLAEIIWIHCRGIEKMEGGITTLSRD